MFKRIYLAIVILGLAGLPAAAQAQPATAAPAPQGRGGFGGIPNVTPEQTAAITQMNTDLAPLTQALAAARSAVAAESVVQPRNDAAIRTKVAAVKTAELALANARADAFAKIQASPNKFAQAQVAALAAGGGGRGGRGGGGGSIPDLSPDQGRMLYQMDTDLTLLMQALATARTAVTTAAYAEPRNNAAIESKADAVSAAELALANARVTVFARLQASSNKLAPEQVTAFIAAGGSLGGAVRPFTQPEPIDFNYHKGYVSLFDGVSLKGWDGNPKFWRVENGAIVGESTATNPSGNSYLVYRDVEAHDFTLKFEIKIEGAGGSGLQYRSKTGIPWLSPIPPAVTANVGPVNLNWMMTGPQADFWPTNGADTYSGQFYSENDPMRIMAWRGQVVEGAGLGTRHLMGNIGDRKVLGDLVKKNDWNEYTIIARGGTFIHIINGQLMSVMVDDDPKSTNNQSGLFGIEIEQITKISVRNIWLKKLN